MSRLRALLLVTTILPIAACSGANDIASPGEGVIVVPSPTPTPPTTPSPPTVPPGTPAAACPTIEGVTDAGTSGAFRLCRLPTSITTDRRLTRVNNLAYVIDGRVDVGIDLGGANAPNATGRSAILTIDPGVIIVANSGDATNDLMVVNRGSRINAEGTPTQPIIFTARENTTGNVSDTTQGLWGGVILAGRAPTSDCSTTAGSTSLVGGSAGCQNIVEGTGNVAYGGEVANDSSGTFRYVQIRYSGTAISAGNELQGLTTGSVGRGTTIDHVQVHNSADDGVEIFGGTGNYRYLVVTGSDDDDFDTDFGYNGSIQFVLGIKRTGNGSSDPRNLEADSNNNREAAPRQFLRLANFTFIQPLNFESLFIRGGADATLVNGIVRGLGTGACLNIDHPETIRAATNAPPADPASGVVAANRGPPVFSSVVFECASQYRDDGNITAAEIQAVFTAGTNNNAAATNVVTNTYFPGTGATGVTAFNAAMLNPAGESFLVTTNFIGAVSTSNQAEFQGWTCNSGYAGFGSTSASCTSLPSV
jgi:hypothetical protein